MLEIFYRLEQSDNSRRTDRSSKRSTFAGIISWEFSEFKKHIRKKILEIVKKEGDIQSTVDSVEHYHGGFYRILREILFYDLFYYTTALALPFTAIIRIKVQLLSKLDSLDLTIIRFYYYFIKIQFL